MVLSEESTHMLGHAINNTGKYITHVGSSH